MKTLMAGLAWATAVLVVLAQVVQVPSIELRISAFEDSPAGRIAVVTVLIVWALSALGLWVVSLAHAWKRARAGAAPYYPVAVLAVTSFVGSLVYYFAFARHHDNLSAE